MQNLRQSVTVDSGERAENAAAIDALLVLGLIDAVDENGVRAYRVSEALYRHDYLPNAALRARIVERLSE